MIIFATYYQSLLVGLASQKADGNNFTAADAIRWNNLILCAEMVIFAVGLLVAFPIKEFVGGIPDRRLLSNVKDVFAVDDVLQNMYINFNPTYRDYALQRSQAEAPDMGRLSNTFGGSNLNSVAIEMTGVYRGKSKRLAFNSLLRGEQPIKAKLRSSHNSTLSSSAGLLSGAHEYGDHHQPYRRRSLSGVSGGSAVDNPILEHSMGHASALPPELMVTRALTSDSVESPLQWGREEAEEDQEEEGCEGDEDEQEIYLGSPVDRPTSPRQLQASTSSSSITAAGTSAPKFRVNLNLTKKGGSKDKLKMTPPRVSAVTSGKTNLSRATSGSDVGGASVFLPPPPGIGPSSSTGTGKASISVGVDNDSSSKVFESKEQEQPSDNEFGVSSVQLERADTVGSGDESWGEFEACRSSKSESMK